MSDINISPDKLKQSILQEAMQGKLTKQSSQDGDSSDLLQYIDEEKQRLIKSGKIKRPKELAPIKDDDTPFRIPDNWQWVRFSNLYNMVGGSQPPKSTFIEKNDSGYIRLYQTRDYGPHPRPVYIPLDKARKITHEGDILVARYGGSLGKTFKAHYGAYNVAMAKVDSIIDFSPLNINYLWYYLQSDFYQSFIVTLNKSAQSGFNKKDLSKLIMPIPPLTEQKRIVAKLDEVLPKVASLKQSVDSIQSLRDELPSRLRRSLLQSAMQGKLTQQSSQDGNASNLLQSINEEKEQLVKTGKIKKQKELAPVRDDEIPFKIPNNWEWVRLNDVGVWKSGSTPKRNHSEYYGGNIPWLKTGDLNDNYINDTTERITQSGVNHSSLNINPIGSVLIAMYGATISKLGILNIRATTNQACCACNSYDGIYNRFLFYYLMSQRSNLIALGEGGAQPNISRTKIVHYVFPLPPLAEQKRIADKLDSMFEHIDNM